MPLIWTVLLVGAVPVTSAPLVWVDKRVLLKHTGTYVFDFQAQDQLYKDLHAMAQANAGGVAAPVDAPAATPAPAVSKVLASSKKIEAKKKANNK